MKVGIVGPGALGCLLAGLLSEAGHQVVLLGREGSDIGEDGEETKGVRITKGGEERCLPLRVTSRPQELEGSELVIMAVKAHSTTSALERLRDVLWRGDATLLSLQNGLGNYEAMVRLVGEGRALIGVTYQASTWLGPCRVLHAAEGETLIGGEGEEARSRAREVKRQLGRALQLRCVDDPWPHIWGKLLVNASINPLTALTKRRNGELLGSEELLLIMRRICEEGLSVALALGIRPQPEDPYSHALRVARSTANNKSSMLQDLERGRRSEVEQINGAIAELAVGLGLEAPINRLMVRLMKEAEALGPTASAWEPSKLLKRLRLMGFRWQDFVKLF